MWYHNEKLFGSIQSGWDDIMASAVEQGRVPFHQGHRDSTEELARWLSLITTLLPGQSLPKSPHHICCHTMKSTESFYRQRKKLESLGSTCFCSISHFSVIGFRESPACFCCCACHIGWGERAGNWQQSQELFWGRSQNILRGFFPLGGYNMWIMKFLREDTILLYNYFFHEPHWLSKYEML